MVYLRLKRPQMYPDHGIIKMIYLWMLEDVRLQKVLRVKCKWLEHVRPVQTCCIVLLKYQILRQDPAWGDESGAVTPCYNISIPSLSVSVQILFWIRINKLCRDTQLRNTETPHHNTAAHLDNNQAEWQLSALQFSALGRAERQRKARCINLSTMGSGSKYVFYKVSAMR